jgi:septal ring factor EnvC (AmiA/AmiB activator)
MPARGQLISRFDESTALGLSTKGIVIETRARAQIVAPFDGRIAFAGPFREYGLLLIIDHGEGYHTLLAGMGQIDVLLDQHVLAGEPVGVMGSPGDEKPQLYVELRKRGHPINPLPWLAAESIKVSG